jgi:hypothetical protein
MQAVTNEWRNVWLMISRIKPKKLGEYPATVPLHPPSIPHEVTWD